MDVKNTLEVLDFAASLLKRLADAKADDGVISLAEIGDLALASAPEAVKAVMGSRDIAAELKDLELAEAKLIAERSIEIAQLLFVLVVKK